MPIGFACRLCLLPLHVGLPLRHRSSVRVGGKLEPEHAVARWQLSTGGSRPPVLLLQRVCLTTACPALETLCTITPRHDMSGREIPGHGTSGHGTRGAGTTRMQAHEIEMHWYPSHDLLLMSDVACYKRAYLPRTTMRAIMCRYTVPSAGWTTREVCPLKRCTILTAEQP